MSMTTAGFLIWFVLAAGLPQAALAMPLRLVRSCADRGGSGRLAVIALGFLAVSLAAALFLLVASALSVPAHALPWASLAGWAGLVSVTVWSASIRSRRAGRRSNELRLLVGVQAGVGVALMVLNIAPALAG